MTASIIVRDLGVRFGDASILDNVTFAVDAGVLTCVAGPNGAGKTTLLRCLAGEFEPTAGWVTISDHHPASMTPTERAGLRSFLAQEERSDIPYTVEDVVGFGTHRSTLDAKGQREVAKEAMDAVGLSAIADRIVASLSGGERRRVAFARTLAQDAPSMFLDEPTDSLDLAHADAVMRIAAERAHRGRVVIATSHDLNMASRHADRIVMLSGGVVVADGSPTDVLTPELLSTVYECHVRVTLHPDDGRPLVFL